MDDGDVGTGERIVVVRGLIVMVVMVMVMMAVDDGIESKGRGRHGRRPS